MWTELKPDVSREILVPLFVSVYLFFQANAILLHSQAAAL
jgi:hypothetical protein